MITDAVRSRSKSPLGTIGQIKDLLPDDLNISKLFSIYIFTQEKSRYASNLLIFIYYRRKKLFQMLSIFMARLY